MSAYIVARQDWLVIDFMAFQEPRHLLLEGDVKDPLHLFYLGGSLVIGENVWGETV